MSEYLSKKAVLEWLDERRYKSPWIESFRDRLESGAFDADNTEIQRLRAALDWLKRRFEEEWTYELGIGEVVEEIIAKFEEALSTATESTGQKDADDLISDRIDERCPKCGADLLANKVGDKWCSLVGCDYSINAPEEEGNA